MGTTTKKNTKQVIVRCPVCGTRIWSHALKIHITNAGKAELFGRMDFMMRHARNKPYTFSPAIVLRNCPHYNFRRKHITSKLIFKI